MDPRVINDSQFAPLHYPYQTADFTIALGTWEDDYKSLGMRWNGDGDSGGYPLGRGGKPKWFVVPPDVAWAMLSALLASPTPPPGVDVAAITASLNILYADR